MILNVSELSTLIIYKISKKLQINPFLIQKLIFEFFIGKHLGKGTFGQVKLGQHTLTGEKVAIKILEKDKINDQKDVERITREIKILKKVRHPNVI